MGCGFCIQRCKQSSNKKGMFVTDSEVNIVIDKPQKKNFFNLNEQKQINENINCTNSNIVNDNSNNNKKNQNGIKNDEKANNSSINSDSENQQKMN